MADILMRAGSFVSIILLGYFLKKIGFFKQEDFTILSRITIRITLPATIITSFAGKEIDMAMLSLVFLAIGCGLIYIAIGFLINRRKPKEQQAFEMLNLPGYNIGTFVIPFAQSFLGPLGVIAVSLFDTGNAVICLGGAYSLASMVKEGNGFSLKRIGKALASSVPFVCYVIMLTMNLLKIPVPNLVLSAAGIIGNANAFMAMLMIGVGFKLEGSKSQTGTVVKLLAIRYGVAAVFALIFYYLLPFALEVRQALVILAFSPIGSAVPGFTGELKGDVGLSSALNSIAMVISIVIIVVLLLVML
ncbi:MAG: AEC family transporter [Oscillospiraceae bacterium]|nr:AEC family transporter [Oscillospiraceae bacterium]